jgi:hypothetical protein
LGAADLGAADLARARTGRPSCAWCACVGAAVRPGGR